MPKRKFQKLASVFLLLGIGLVLGGSFYKETPSKSSKNMEKSVLVGGVKIPLVEEGRGLYQVRNEYVFKGGDRLDESASLPNVVLWNNLVFRIIKVNEDSSIKLVLFGKWKDTTQKIEMLKIHGIFTNYEDSPSVLYEKSALRTFLNEDILHGRILDENTNQFLSLFSKKMLSNLVPFQVDVSTLKDIALGAQLKEPEASSFKDYVGLLSAREYIEASSLGTWNKATQTYTCKTPLFLPSLAGCKEENYLKNLEGAFTTTVLEKTKESSVYAIVTKDEKTGLTPVSSTTYLGSVFPVVCLAPTVSFTKGNGTLANPYKIL